MQDEYWNGRECIAVLKDCQLENMPRILAIDFGLKRTGIAVTDPLQIVANGLTTVPSPELFPFLKNYFSKEPVELILVGEPRSLNDSPTHATAMVREVVEKLKKEFPAIEVKTLDERFTSKMASRAMIDMGMKKNKDRIKRLLTRLLRQFFFRDTCRDRVKNNLRLLTDTGASFLKFTINLRQFPDYDTTYSGIWQPDTESKMQGNWARLS